MKYSPLAQRLVTGVILLAAFLFALFLLPPLGWALVMLLGMLLAAGELGRLLASTGFERWQVAAAPHYRWLLPLGLLAAVAAFFVVVRGQGTVERMELLVVCYAVALLMALTLVPWWLFCQEKKSLPVSRGLRAAFAVVGGWLLFCAWLATVQLQSFSPWVLLAVLALMWLADSAAYFAGRAFGQRKLAPKISPGKTWEGAMGALLAVTVYAIAVAPFLLPTMSIMRTLSTATQWIVWLCLAWVLTALSIMGDLFESLIKRIADQKDSGQLLPGHGGVLDRIDSLLTTVPVAALIATLLG